VADTRRPCPCCGHLVFDIEDGWPGSYAICAICCWEDDNVQFRWPFVVGANRVALHEAQRNFIAYGACDQSGRKYVRPPAENEPVDPAWRPIDPDVDFFEEWGRQNRRPWPADPSLLCWWLPSFWGQPEDPPPPPRLAIDLAAVHDERELHSVLKQALDFPDSYGMNWSAFWDTITGLVELPAELAFTGWAAFEQRCPEAAAMLRGQLDRYVQTHKDFTARYGS